MVAASARRVLAWSYWAWIGHFVRLWSGDAQVKQSPSAIAFALLAVRAALRAAARLFAERSIAAGPVQAGLVVVLWETGIMGLARGLVCFWFGAGGLVEGDPRLISAAH